MTLDVEKSSECSDCKVRLPPFDGPVHEYLGGNASCWKMYGEILAREYGDFRYMKFHRWTVDAYAAQHPGKPEPRATASVYIHLLGLFLLIEQNRDPAFVTTVMQRISKKRKEQLTWLTPPNDLGDITVQDIYAAETPEEHCEKVIAWGKSVWNAWITHHVTIKSFAGEFLEANDDRQKTERKPVKHGHT